MHDPIEVFRGTVERLRSVSGILGALDIQMARAEELPELIACSSSALEREWLLEEQMALGHSTVLRIRKSALEHELTLGLLRIRQPLHDANTAARHAVTIAAGGTEVVKRLPFACRHLDMLARYRDPLAPHESLKKRLEHLEAAWSAIDAAMAALDEIRFVARQRENRI